MSVTEFTDYITEVKLECENLKKCITLYVQSNVEKSANKKKTEGNYVEFKVGQPFTPNKNFSFRMRVH